MIKNKIGVSNSLLKSGNNGHNYITFFLKKWFDLVSISSEQDLNRYNNFVAFIFDNHEDVVIRKAVEKFPLLPVETAKNVNNPLERDRFIVSIFILKRWRELDTHIDSIIEFHKNHEYLFLSFDEIIYKKLDRMVMQKKLPFYSVLKIRYERDLLYLLKHNRKRGNIFKVLLKIYDQLKDKLSEDDRYELGHMIRQYKRDEVPLLEPVTLINHYAKSLDIHGLKGQYFINPSTVELNLLFHV